MDAERQRLADDAARRANWKRWGPYLAERQWGTVREDYSADGNVWDSFPHDHARSRAYRWGEDGLLGLTDRECRLCFALALWNGRDPILKERLYGLSGVPSAEQGNHGEDCKELYYYLDATPTFSYFKGLYKYPQAAYPYDGLRAEGLRRNSRDPEFEILDSGAFDGNRYFDVLAEYAKAGPDDVLIRLTISNRGPEEAAIDVLPTLWFRNTWIWGCEYDGCTLKPRIRMRDAGALATSHDTLEEFRLQAEPGPGGEPPRFLFTENETNSLKLYGTAAYTPYVKDAFHECVVNGRGDAVNPAPTGTKAAAWYKLRLAAGGSATLHLRLHAAAAAPAEAFGPGFESVFADRIREADAFYDGEGAPGAEVRRIRRQAYAGTLWSRQFYHFSVRDWIKGDPAVGAPPESRQRGRNAAWRQHFFARDVLSMPDKWEYPWFAAWDLAFHCVAFARIDPAFAKEQLILLLREWYMHPNGELPAYEFAFDDVNPPVHAWACWRVYKMTGEAGARDIAFLQRAFHKLIMNFTWWVNRKDPLGRNLFAGGFLGLDNVGVFDRSKPLPTGGYLEQADATAWMAFYCSTMLSIAIELAQHDAAYEDVASKFFEHFVAIADAINGLGDDGLWDEEDGFYYDRLHVGGRSTPLKIRSIVGLIPLCAVDVLHHDQVERLPGFRKRMAWFLKHRGDLGRHISWMTQCSQDTNHRLLAIPNVDRLKRELRYLLDEEEFLSPFGIRSLSRHHRDHPYVFHAGGEEFRVDYRPGESDTGLFGGNSNWRGPVWFPVNYLLIEALERYHHFFGDTLLVEYPANSGRRLNLKQIADDIAHRLIRLFAPDKNGQRPCHGDERRYAEDPAFRDLILFYEYFHGDSGKGLGASHQTGWTALAAKLIEDLQHSP